LITLPHRTVVSNKSVGFRIYLCFENELIRLGFSQSHEFYLVEAPIHKARTMDELNMVIYSSTLALPKRTITISVLFVVIFIWQ
jgi:hypothetical protein